MLELSPDEIDAYLNFFPNLDEALKQCTMSISSKSQRPASYLKIIEDRIEHTKREYQKAKSGEIWLSNTQYKRMRSEILEGQCDADTLKRVDESLRVYSEVAEYMKYGRNLHWGVATIARSILKPKFQTLLGGFDLEATFTLNSEFEEFSARSIGSLVSAGKSGEAINNAYVISAYMTQERHTKLKFLSCSLFTGRLLKITRAGAWVSQSVGQWRKFKYFWNTTSEIAKKAVLQQKSSSSST